MKVRAHQYDTVDALCWRHYGRTQGVTEQVLKANPGLAEYGPFLPHGLQVELTEVLEWRYKAIQRSGANDE
ncbi:TPA: tail protein X [Escherichia coli]